jgi:NAD(P)H-flavin reductase
MATAAEIAPATGPMTPRPFRVVKRRRDTVDTWTLELEPVSGPPLDFVPGQFTMLYAFGVGEVPISVSGDPAHTGVVTHTTREVGSVTRAMRRLRRGATLGVRGPYGTPWPLDRAVGRDLVLVAGGIGLAPLRPVLYAAAARRAEFGNVVLLYGTRSPEDVLYRRELERWRAAHGVIVSVTVDHATRAWPGDVGVVTRLVARAPFDAASAVAFVCGPEIMMRFAADALRRRGLAEERVFLSLERNMKCAVGFCGHCQLGPTFVCKDGPVFPYPRVKRLLELREI